MCGGYCFLVARVACECRAVLLVWGVWQVLDGRPTLRGEVGMMQEVSVSGPRC